MVIIKENTVHPIENAIRIRLVLPIEYCRKKKSSGIIKSKEIGGNNKHIQAQAENDEADSEHIPVSTEQTNIAAEQTEAEVAEVEAKAKAQAEAKKRAEAEHIAAEKAEAERIATEKAEAKQAEANQNYISAEQTEAEARAEAKKSLLGHLPSIQTPKQIPIQRVTHERNLDDPLLKDIYSQLFYLGVTGFEKNKSSDQSKVIEWLKQSRKDKGKKFKNDVFSRKNKNNLKAVLKELKSMN